jgi:hypothetical protein
MLEQPTREVLFKLIRHELGQRLVLFGLLAEGGPVRGDGLVEDGRFGAMAAVPVGPHFPRVSCACRVHGSA